MDTRRRLRECGMAWPTRIYVAATNPGRAPAPEAITEIQSQTCLSNRNPEAAPGGRIMIASRTRLSQIAYRCDACSPFSSRLSLG